MVFGTQSNTYLNNNRKMQIKKYLIGSLRGLFNPAVSLLAQIDNVSVIDRRAKVYGHTKVFNSKLGAYS